MAANKNFVVKNGLEGNTDLVLANATSKRVGIGSTVPAYKLDVAGGIGATSMVISGIATVGVLSATDIVVSGASTFAGDLEITGALSFDNISGTNLYVSGIGTIGVLTATDAVITGASTITGDLTVGGNLDVTGDITYDEISGRRLNITGISTLEGLVYGKDGAGAILVGTGLSVAGITTLASSGGITTTGGDLYVGGDLYGSDDITYDED